MKEFSKKIQAKFAEMQKTGKLFRVELTGLQIWDLYLSSFSKENNPAFRDPESSTFNCKTCNNFIRRYSNIVAVDENYKIITMFDVETTEEFENTVKVLSTAIKASKITEVFFETFEELNELPYESCNKKNKVFQLGVAKNDELYTEKRAYMYSRENSPVKPGEIRTFNHLHLFLDNQYVDTTGDSVATIMASYRESKNVFQRAMETIPLDTLNLVKDLMLQESLLDGTAHLYKVNQFIPLKEEYDSLQKEQKDNWCWVKSYKLSFARFRNELVGKLCTELAEGVELNKACLLWNKNADPANYMKAKAPFTEKQRQAAKNFIVENGYEKSFVRRCATLDDIKVSEILHSNVGDGEIKKVSMFDNLKPTSTRHKRSEFDKVEEVTIEKFMKDILPTCSSVEAFLLNNHESNMVTLTTADDPESKPMFKYPNNFSKTFNGNLAGNSQIKEAVKQAGGRVDGVLRCSLIWNEKGTDTSDLDLWCQQPNGQKVGFSEGYRKDDGDRKTSLSGQLDLDMRYPGKNIGIENIYFGDLRKMLTKPGIYKFWVNQWSPSNSQGFKAEIEFNGEQYIYEYNRPLSSRENVAVAEVTLHENGEFSIKHYLPVQESGGASKEIYGLETNKFHKVNLICLSPNNWGKNEIGTKHYLFMLEDCKAPGPIRSYHNEDFISELAEHRKVLEPLGTANMIESTDKQLSGVGFNATVREELVVKLKGTHQRVVKIKF